MMCKLIKWSEFDQLISTRDGRHKEEWATSLVVDVSGNMYIFHISLAPDVCPLLGILQLKLRKRLEPVSHQTFVLCLAFCNSIPYV